MSDYSTLVNSLEPSQTEVIDLDADTGMQEYSSVNPDIYQASLHKCVQPIYP